MTAAARASRSTARSCRVCSACGPRSSPRSSRSASAPRTVTRAATEPAAPTRRRPSPSEAGQARSMREDELRALLTAVARRELTLEEAVDRLAQLPFVDLGEAKLDLHREIRS